MHSLTGVKVNKRISSCSGFGLASLCRQNAAGSHFLMINIQDLTFHRKNPIECGFKMCARTRCLIEFFTGRLPNATLFAFPLSPAFCPGKSPPSGYPSFSFFGCPHASLFVIHQDISGPKIFCNFSRQPPP